MPDQLSGATRLFPIIGDPVTAVQSPASLTRTFADRGHPAMCVPLQVAAEDLDVVLAGLAASGNLDGILVTMPHKATAFAHCATSSTRSQLLGVVSVIRRNHDRSWHGDMLDGLAFVKAQTDHGATIRGSKALLVGAGGAGSAIAAALLDGGVSQLVLHDTDHAKAKALLKLLTRAGHGQDQVSVGSGDPNGFDLVLNATPMGMNVDDPLPVDPNRLNSQMFVGDVIAGHGTTPLLQAAQDAGCRTANGVDMVNAVQALMPDFFLNVPRDAS